MYESIVIEDLKLGKKNIARCEQCESLAEYPTRFTVFSALAVFGRVVIKVIGCHTTLGQPNSGCSHHFVHIAEKVRVDLSCG